MTSLTLLVLRANDPDGLARFYGAFGLSFRDEKHGNGPRHKSCDLGGATLEIYPASPNAPPTSGARIGFAVSSVHEALQACRPANILSPPKQTAWGYRAVLQDPEGHTVELAERYAAIRSESASALY